MRYYANTKHNTASTGKVISEKIGDRKQLVQNTMIKGTVYQEHRTILTVCTASNSFKMHEVKLSKLKGKIDKSIVIEMLTPVSLLLTEQAKI